MNLAADDPNKQEATVVDFLMFNLSTSQRGQIKEPA